MPAKVKIFQHKTMTSKTLISIFIAFYFSSFLGFAAQPDDIIGEWDISLYYSKLAPPSSTKLVVSGVENGVLSGTFYGSPFIKGRITTLENDVLFTVVTEDASGLYSTSGRLTSATTIAGQTLAHGREFLMPWQGVKQTAR